MEKMNPMRTFDKFILSLIITTLFLVVIGRGESASSEPTLYSEYLSISKSLDDQFLIYHFNFNQKDVLHYLIDKYDLDSFRVTFSRGRFNYREWGIFSNSKGLPPSGVAVYAEFKNNTKYATSDLWDGLVNELSGIFCASLNFLTYRDERRVYDSGIVNFVNNNTMYGTLSEEVVCTENLTPFKSLLPYRGNRGISALLIPKLLFSSQYMSMTIEMTGNNINMDVYRVVKRMDGEYETFRFILNKKPVLSIPYGDSNIYVNNVDDISKELTSVLTNTTTPFEEMTPSHVHIKRYQVSNLLITNIEVLKPVKELCLYDVIPWYFKTYIHTLTVNGKRIHQANVKSVKVLPHKDRIHPFILDICFDPQLTNIEVSIEFDKVYLKYTEHAPDAHRGFDLSSAIVTVDGNVKYFSDSLLISLPTPDFSMPYNVITLTCTVIVLFFGSLFNLLIRRFNSKYEEEQSKSLLERMIGFVAAKFKKDK